MCQGRRRETPTIRLEKFAREYWQSGVPLTLKPASARDYRFLLDRRILPALGSSRNCHMGRAPIGAFLLDQKWAGYSNSTIDETRTTPASRKKLLRPEGLS